MFDQRPSDGLAKVWAEKNVGVLARCPFDEGGLTGAITPGVTFPKGDWRERYFSGDRPLQVAERVEKLRKAIGDAAESLPDAALRHRLSDPGVSTLIPGIRKHANAETN